MTVDAGRVAIVTGAGGGIGRAICMRLGAQGWCVALVGRTRSSLEETRGAMRHAGAADDAVMVLAVDLARPHAAAEVVDAVMRRWERVDALINNAAVAPCVPLVESDDELWRDTFEIDLFASARLVRRLWPVLAERDRACIVNISSMSAIDPFPGLGVYAAAKAGLESLTRSIMNEQTGDGLRAFSIAPGCVETPMLRSIVSRDDLPPDQTMDPDDVARVVIECIDGARNDKVGQSIRLSGPG